MNIIFCETSSDIAKFENKLSTAKGDIYLDLEGLRLGKGGTICLLQFTTGGVNDPIFVIDLIQTPEFLKEGRLRYVLESDDWTKFIFDPRGDSANLFDEYGILMKNVKCLQLSEIAFDRQTKRKRTFVSSLTNVMRRVLSYEEYERARTMKEKGKGLFSSNTCVFKIRPLDALLLEYSAYDVKYLIKIKKEFYDKLDDTWKLWVEDRSRERVELAESSEPLPSGKEACLAPS